MNWKTVCGCGGSSGSFSDGWLDAPGKCIYEVVACLYSIVLAAWVDNVNTRPSSAYFVFLMYSISSIF